MSYMKDLDIRIRSGGDDAIAAACELAGLAKERRGYDETMRDGPDITDIVTVLRGVGFSTVSPQAGDSASLLHYCVTHAADEIEHLRNERRWIPVSERLPVVDVTVLAVTRAFPKNIRLAQMASRDGVMWRFCDMDDDDVDSFGITHWAPLPEPPASPS